MRYFMVEVLCGFTAVAAALAQPATRPFSGHASNHPLNQPVEKWLRVLEGTDVEARRRLLAGTSGAYKVDLTAFRPALLRALEDEDDYVRLQGAATIGRNDQQIPPSPAADETLKVALRVAGEQGRNQSVAIEALGAFADQSEEAVQKLVSLAVGSDWNAAQSAARVASHASDGAVSALTDGARDAADPRGRLMIYNALGQAPGERRLAAADALFRALPRDDSNAFFTGIKSLWHLDRRRLLESDLLKGTLPRYLAALQPPEKVNDFAAMTEGLLGAEAAPAIPHLVRHAVWVEHESTGSVEQKGW